MKNNVSRLVGKHRHTLALEDIITNTKYKATLMVCINSRRGGGKKGEIENAKDSKRGKKGLKCAVSSATLYTSVILSLSLFFFFLAALHASHATGPGDG